MDRTPKSKPKPRRHRVLGWFRRHRDELLVGLVVAVVVAAGTGAVKLIYTAVEQRMLS